MGNRLGGAIIMRKGTTFYVCAHCKKEIEISMPEEEYCNEEFAHTCYECGKMNYVCVDINGETMARRVP